MFVARKAPILVSNTKFHSEEKSFFFFLILNQVLSIAFTVTVTVNLNIIHFLAAGRIFSRTVALVVRMITALVIFSTEEYLRT